jgi:hypothetical protein
VRILLCEIERRAAERPPGYVEDVLSRGMVVGDELELSEEAYRELVAKYDPKRFPVVARAKREGQSLLTSAATGNVHKFE